jgi:hypothetical protein
VSGRSSACIPLLSVCSQSSIAVALAPAQASGMASTQGQSLHCCCHRFKYHSAFIFDSAAAFFGRDNVGLPGVAHFFKVMCALHPCMHVPCMPLKCVLLGR